MCPGCNQGGSVALARGRARTANTGARACYIRSVKLGPLLPFQGTVPSLSPSIAPGAASIKGSTVHFTPTEEGQEENGALFHLSATSALHGVKAPWH